MLACIICLDSSDLALDNRCVLYVLNLEMLVPWGPGGRGLQVHADLHRSAFNCTVVYTIDIHVRCDHINI